MYKCDFCGRESFKKIRYGGHTVCSKHMHQMNKYGKIQDTNPRTTNDLNDYEIKNDLVFFNVYNQKNEYIDYFYIDLEDIEKIKYHKWRKSHGHFVTGLPAKKQQKDISWIILGITDLQNKVVDHIDGNPRNNTKANLRLCEQGENVLNKSFMSNNTSGFIGISYRAERDRYDPEIRLESQRCHLGYQKTLEEAVYARYIAEGIVFKDFTNQEEHQKKYNFTKTLSEQRKKEIEDLVIAKLQAKNLGN